MAIVARSNITDADYNEILNSIGGEFGRKYIRYCDSGDKADVKMMLMLGVGILLRASPANNPMISFSKQNYISGLPGGRNCSDKNFYKLLRSYDVRRELVPIMEAKVLVDKFMERGQDQESVCVSICVLCDHVIVGANLKSFKSHFIESHNPGRKLFYGGQCLYDFVTNSGRCIKCGLMYELFENSPDNIKRLMLVSMFHSHSHKHRIYHGNIEEKNAVRNHIIDCFKLPDNINKKYDRMATDVMEEPDEYIAPMNIPSSDDEDDSYDSEYDSTTYEDDAESDESDDSDE